ncbi:glycosyltransferase family 2 protein [Algoriphagus resistens]|uniref:glycosyltransferase family 2 protein n=1 Tax=Algoriphagus resistens TaxID=1750590 RepID=UPI0007168DBE|nr:glycosyltransferase family A protein [Algoriphagus resistens]
MFFSIVIPFYNRMDYLGYAIESVLNQNYSNWELILVNDSSSDKSVDVVKKYTDSRIKLISLLVNGGNAKARNEGWKAAVSDWVVYLDSDDWLESNYLENLYQSIQGYPETSFFWTGVRFINSHSKILKEEFWQPRESLPGSTFFDELRIGTNCGVAFKRELLETHQGFDESFKASVDREFFLRISKEEKGLGINKILVNCLIGDHESVRKNYASQSEAYNKLIALHRQEIQSTNSRKKWWYHKAMWLALYCGNTAIARAYLLAMNCPIKSLLLYSIFSLFPLGMAKDLHKKLA